VALVADGEDELGCLFEAAPDLVRALLKVEWRGISVCEPACPACGEFEDDGKHAANCQLDAALRKAGVR
jgi:hypothetical protein